MKKKVLIVLTIALALCAVLGAAACENGNYLSGTYKYVDFSVSLAGNDESENADLKDTMKATYDNLYKNSFYSFNKDEMVMSVLGVSYTMKYEMDGNKVVYSSGNASYEGKITSQEMVVDGDTIYIIGKTNVPGTLVEVTFIYKKV